jgi:hypothetical protein
MSDTQAYDSALKSLLGDDVAEILPNLLPGAEFVSEQNVEIDRTTIRADIVYNIKYRGLPHILNMELQTVADAKMPLRLLRYHVGLLEKHEKPVISMVMYPFETAYPASPFEELSGDEVILSLKYKILLLWKLVARQFVDDHVVGMYALLPAMKGANAQLLIQAIKEMEQHYSVPRLVRHLVRLRTLLRRSGTISAQDRQIVEEYMQTYDSLLDSDPYLQQKWELERTLERNQGLQVLRDIIVAITRSRFPALTEIVQQRVASIQNYEELKQLNIQLALAPNEAAARKAVQEAKID